MKMDEREEGRLEREVSWEKTPFGKEVNLLLLRSWREWECDDEWNEMRMERDLRLILLSKMFGGREVSWLESRFMNEGRKGMRNNEEGVRRGNNTRFLRLVKVDWWSDSNEFDWRFIEIWNGNEDEEELKEVIEKGEVIEDIRGNGGEFVGIQPTWEIEWEDVDVKWWLSVRSRMDRLLSPLKTPEGREVSLLLFKVKSVVGRWRSVERIERTDKWDFLDYWIHQKEQRWYS